MNVKSSGRLAAALLSLAALAGATSSQATIFTVSLTGNVADFHESQVDSGGLHFDQFSLPLSGLSATSAFAVSQGDEILSTVTLDTAYTIPASQVRTDLVHYFTGSAFPAENTGVTGVFNFYNGGTLTNTFAYSSTTSSQLASFAAVFPPNNGAFTFDSFTNDVTITDLATPATIDGSQFTYSLVSNAVPEPATWALTISGFGLIGAALRRRRAPFPA